MRIFIKFLSNDESSRLFCMLSLRLTAMVSSEAMDDASDDDDDDDDSSDCDKRRFKCEQSMTEANEGSSCGSFLLITCCKSLVFNLAAAAVVVGDGTAAIVPHFIISFIIVVIGLVVDFVTPLFNMKSILVVVVVGFRDDVVSPPNNVDGEAVSTTRLGFLPLLVWFINVRNSFKAV
jgi:hypothetical protein